MAIDIGVVELPNTPVVAAALVLDDGVRSDFDFAAGRDHGLSPKTEKGSEVGPAPWVVSVRQVAGCSLNGLA